MLAAPIFSFSLQVHVLMMLAGARFVIVPVLLLAVSLATVKLSSSKCRKICRPGANISCGHPLSCTNTSPTTAYIHLRIEPSIRRISLLSMGSSMGEQSNPGLARTAADVTHPGAWVSQYACFASGTLGT